MFSTNALIKVYTIRNISAFWEVYREDFIYKTVEYGNDEELDLS